MTETQRQAISEGRKRQAAEYRRQQAEMPQPDKKKCPGCGRWKRVDKDFGRSKVRYANGDTGYRPRSRCKKCSREQGAMYRERLGNEELKRRYKRYNKGRRATADKRNHVRQYQREWYRMKVTLEGRELKGTHKKYRDEHTPAPRVDRERFVKQLHQFGLGPEELSKITGLPEKTFRRKDTSLVLLSTVDQAFSRLGRPDLVATLFG